MIKTYVEFFYPTELYLETKTEAVSKQDFDLTKFPNGSDCFRFFDKEESIKDGERVSGEVKNYSGKCYLGRICTLEEAKKLPNSENIIRNMIINRNEKVVETVLGRILPLESGDIVREFWI